MGSEKKTLDVELVKKYCELLPENERWGGKSCNSGNFRLAVREAVRRSAAIATKAGCAKYVVRRILAQIGELNDMSERKQKLPTDPKQPQTHQHFWRTVERNGRWISECETCPAERDITGLTEAQLERLAGE